MKFKLIAGIYSITVGFAMVCMWILFITNNQVSEIHSEPVKITYHLIAEFLTAGLLLFAGFGLFTNRKWGFHLFLTSMGMLIYTVIVSAGYYAQENNMIMVGMFTIFQILTIIFILLSFYYSKELK